MPRMSFNHVPLAKWPRKATESYARKQGPFKSQFQGTLSKLASELAKLGAINPVLITTDHQGRNDVRIDGLPRTDISPRTPGVVIEFYALPHGKDGERERMQFACDTYTKWVHNLHAIALTLESLRAIDRYGATSAGEQYAGFRALPAPGMAMTVEKAAETLAAIPGVGATARMLMDSKQTFLDAYRAATKKAHPDAGGSPDLWRLVQTADAVMRVHHHL